MFVVSRTLTGLSSGICFVGACSSDELVSSSFALMSSDVLCSSAGVSVGGGCVSSLPVGVGGGVTVC